MWLPGVYSGSPAISFGSSDVQLRGLAPAQSTVIRCEEQLPGGFELNSYQTSATMLRGDAAATCAYPRLPFIQCYNFVATGMADDMQPLQVSL